MDLLIAGNVQTVLGGTVTQEGLCKVVLEEMPYALGGAAIPNQAPLSLGETIVYEGVGHIFTVEKPWEEKKRLEAAFLMGVERKPKELIKVIKKQTIASFYEELLKSYSKGFAIVGEVVFSKLSVAYLKLSPIFGENVNVYHDKYWEQEHLVNSAAKLFGVVLRAPDPRAFYSNPNEKAKTALVSHTHVLSPLARHLLTDSEIDSATFWAENIDRITHYR